MAGDLQKRLARIDLNLLPVLLVLIETQSTQATADRIGRTQSAVSHALNRLREMLNDPLFVRHGPKLIPTPLVLDLHAPLTQLLNDSVLLVERGHQFSPEQSDRTFVVGCIDLAMPLAQRICDSLQQAAPNMRFRITGHRKGNARLRQGEVDLLISLYRNSAEPGLVLRQVGAVDWAFYACEKTAPVNTPPSVEDWTRHPHVQVYTGQEGRSPVEDAAQVAGVTRRVGLQVEGFLEALFIASRGLHLFTTFPRLVGPVAGELGLKAYTMPFDVPPAPVALISRQTKFDPLSRWALEIAVHTAEEALGSRQAQASHPAGAISTPT